MGIENISQYFCPYLHSLRVSSFAHFGQYLFISDASVTGTQFGTSLPFFIFVPLVTLPGQHLLAPTFLRACFNPSSIFKVFGYPFCPGFFLGSPFSLRACILSQRPVSSFMFFFAQVSGV